MIHFDTLEYTNGAVSIGVPRAHAEYAAKNMASICKEINAEAITKSYLSKELNSLEQILTSRCDMLDQKFTSMFIQLEQRLIIKLGSLMVVCSGIMMTVLGFLLKH